MSRENALQTIEKTLKNYEKGVCSEGDARQVINEVIDEYFDGDEETQPLEISVNDMIYKLDGQHRCRAIEKFATIFNVIEGGKDKE